MLKKLIDMIDGAPLPRGIVHVGAHLGKEIREYRNYAPDVLVWIEADPAIYQRLQDFVFGDWGLANTAHWCINALVSDTDDDTLDFHLAVNDGKSSSMFESTDTLKEWFPSASPTGEILRLQSKTLNTILSELKHDPLRVETDAFSDRLYGYRHPGCRDEVPVGAGGVY